MNGLRAMLPCSEKKLEVNKDALLNYCESTVLQV
jgi:hypothetical protein